MDRGIPTEAVRAELRQSDPRVRYLVGTPRGRLTQLEAALVQRPGQAVHPHLRVKLLPQEGELYVLAESAARAHQDRGIRRRKLRAYWQRLGQLRHQALIRLPKLFTSAGSDPSESLRPSW
jgi:hypothetical protein